LENTGRFWLWAIELLITANIISFGMLMYGMTVPLQESASRQLQEQNRTIAESQYSAFDYQKVSGSQILTAYRKFSTEDDFYLYVSTKQGGATVKNFAVEPPNRTNSCANFNYGTGAITTGTTACTVNDKNMQEFGNAYYVPPQESFRAQLVRDGNDRVRGIYFRTE
jgi:hypothetical protein